MYEQQEAAVEAAAADLERQRLANEALRERGAALEKWVPLCLLFVSICCWGLCCGFMHCQ